MKNIWTFVICLCMAATAAAQSPASNPDAPSKEQVMQFLNLMHVRERVVQMMDGMKKAMKTGAEAGFKQKVPDPTPAQLKMIDTVSDTTFQDLPIDEMIDGMVPVYQRHISKSDLDAIIAFYSSPTGQRFLKEQPAMMTEGMQVGQDIMMKKLPEITRRLDDRITKLAADEAEKNMSEHRLDK